MFFLPKTFVANMAGKQVTADIMLALFVLGQTLFGTEFSKANVTKKLFIFVRFYLFFRFYSFGLFSIFSSITKMHDSLRNSGRLVDEKLLAAKAADSFILVQSVTSDNVDFRRKKKAILTSCVSLTSFFAKIPYCR